MLAYDTVNNNISSQFLSLAKEVFRGKNSSARGSLFSMQNESILEEKILVGCSESCLGLLGRKSQRQKQCIRRAKSTQETTYRGKRRGLGASEKARGKEKAPGGEGVGKGTARSIESHTGSSVLRVFI